MISYLVNSHFGRLRRTMLALRAMSLFGTDISLYANLHRAKVFGTDIFLYVNLYRAKVFGTDICLGQTYEPKGKVFIQNFFISASIWLQTILFGPPWPKVSKNVLSFKIRPWEVGEKIGHTNIQKVVDLYIDNRYWLCPCPSSFIIILTFDPWMKM